MVVKLNVWSDDKWVFYIEFDILTLILDLFHYYILWDSSFKTVAPFRTQSKVQTFYLDENTTFLIC